MPDPHPIYPPGHLEMYERVTGLRGRSLGLSRPRRWINDLLYFSKQVPSIPVQRRMNLAGVALARRPLACRPSWVAIFAKAFARVADEQPAFRRSYLGLPWGRIYEHPYSIVNVAVERDYAGERAVFFGRMLAPDRQPLAVLDEQLRYFKTAPVESVADFFACRFVSHFPRPLRRLAWCLALNALGGRKANLFGTFGVSVYAARGAESLHPISPITTVVNYGPIGPDGVRGRAFRLRPPGYGRLDRGGRAGADGRDSDRGSGRRTARPGGRGRAGRRRDRGRGVATAIRAARGPPEAGPHFLSDFIESWIFLAIAKCSLMVGKVFSAKVLMFLSLASLLAFSNRATSSSWSATMWWM